MPLTIDEVTTLIDNRRRRLVLMMVDGRSEASIGDLSVEIAAIENDIPPDRVDAEQRKRVYTSLYQNHLEKLDEAGVIEYDERAKVARATEATPAVADFIHCMASKCSNGDSIPSEHSRRGVFDRLLDGILLGVFK